MKKIVVSILSIAMIFALVSCSSKTAVSLPLGTRGSAFECTPDELIDALNAAAENEENVLQIPAFKESFADIYINGTGLTFSIVTSDSGRVKSMDLYWSENAGDAKRTMTTAGFYAALLTNAVLSEEDAKKMEAIMSPSGHDGGYDTFTATATNVSASFATYGGGNKLTIRAGQ